MKLYNYVLSAVCLFCIGTVYSQGIAKDSLPATALKPFGRYIINNHHELELISSAVHFGIGFEGTACNIFVKIPAGTHNYLQYVLDGVYQKRVRIESGSTLPLTITASAEGRHALWIYKATEAHTGAIIIEKITGKNVSALLDTRAALIEFIGNSITCGAAADPSETPCGTGEYHDQHNAYYAYGPRVARELGTGFILSSVSGIGIYRNWNSDGPAMPQVYEKADFHDNSNQLWDFKLFNPQVVSIALGTNDLSNGDGIKKRLPFDSSVFISEYVKFVQLVKSNYPRAQIALLSSPMIHGDARLTLQNCLTDVKQKVDALYPVGKKVALYFFEPMQAHGCGGHPNVEDHAILAKELVPFFKKLLP